MSHKSEKFIQLSNFDAFIFDMDGVVTDTARVHAAAWKQMFDEFLKKRSEDGNVEFQPFDATDDYFRYVDGKPRYDGVRSFLESRGISLSDGDPGDSPDQKTICGLGNRKNTIFLESLEEQGADAYQTTIEFIRLLEAGGIKTAVISASRNCAQVLEAAGVRHLFDVKVDGLDSDNLGLHGKPAPDIFLEAARRIGVEPARAVVVEDALAGVEAGRRGAFGLVIGVDRSGSNRDEMEKLGADFVVNDLSELAFEISPSLSFAIKDLPSALESEKEISQRLDQGTPAVFLDYDGTLTPIVDDPAQALIPQETREVVQRLAGRCTIAIVSGRDLDDVRGMVCIEGIAYAGSHGFDIIGPDGQHREQGHWQRFLTPLDTAQEELSGSLKDIPGARVERKRFAIAVHYRAVDDALVDELEAQVNQVVSRHPELRKTGGKKIFELRPNIDWDKGKALLFLIEALHLPGDRTVPVFIGDDVTDEDGFHAIRNNGIAIVVGEEDRQTEAHYSLRNPEETRIFLEKLAALVESGPE
jgi:trehalose 6-phosphate phosphatase